MSFNNETATDASRVMFINSGDTQPSNSDPSITTDYVFIPDESIVVPAHHTILLSLHHVQIPFSFYNFQLNRNCKMDYGLSTATSTTFTSTGTITIEEGNYNAATLMTAFTTKLNAEANVGTLSMKFNRDTLKYEWNYDNDTGNANNARLTLRIATGANALLNCRDELGFNSNKFIDRNNTFDVWFEDNGANLLCGYSNTGVNTTYFTGAVGDYWDGDNTAEDENIFSVIDVNSGIRSIFVRTNLTQTSVLDSSIGGGFSSILARIPIDVESGGVITISPSDGSVHKLLIKAREITSFEIKLTDQKNRVIDLQGLDWDISLQFDFIETPTLEVPRDKRLEVEEAQYKKYQELKEQLNQTQNKN